MYLAYSLLLTLGFVVLIPHFLFQALAHGKYIAGLRQRLGSIPPVNGKPVIWLHCVSVGETQAARPLAQRVKQEFPHHALVDTTEGTITAWPAWDTGSVIPTMWLVGLAIGRWWAIPLGAVGWTLLVVVGLHVAAALVHLFIYRDRVMARMAHDGVETRPMFYPMHVLPPYRDLQPASAFPVSTSVASRGISLPTWAGLDRGQIERVVHSLRRALAPAG